MLVLTLIILAIGVHFYRNALVMFVVIPVALFCAFSGYNTITTILGYPVKQTIPEESMYIHHIENSDGTELYVWVLEPRRMMPKNFSIPATEQNKKQMQRAKGQKGKGINQLIGKAETKRLGEKNNGDYMVYDFTIDPQGLK
jgi:hypothetical protein